MHEIIGRQEEILELTDAYNSKDAEFIAVFGRRRVGKTYLINSLFSQKKCIYFHTTGIYKGSMNQQ